MIKYRYECKDVAYALSKYVCYVELPLPEGTVYTEDNKPTKLTSVKLAITTEENKCEKYRVPVGSYAEVFGSCNAFTLKTPDGSVFGIGSKLTKDQVDHIIDIATGCEVLERWSGLGLSSDPKLTAVPCGYDWKQVVSTLERTGKVKVRYTDHQYRDDDRNITWVQDYELPHRMSVDGLNWNDKLCDHLIKLLNM